MSRLLLFYPPENATKTIGKMAYQDEGFLYDECLVNSGVASLISF